ncbi:hypothetical protein AVT15_gp071 [Pseudomonas phage vB_PaeM_PS24]|uniref:Uncharacterized protein n=1 Tax=Pseudomonas phage vB_PaeM_PS24 TaxID=1542092 RepID=A0A0K0L9L0_9CAUD|nr:hypothetical protein AVT15_gp071 [Pseudomonas phage vB_PaeM_PS24]AIW01835.1 hypothetical protein vB_PaeM_PS2400133 [Pseudomonas phage vB_PaeM_PS24]
MQIHFSSRTAARAFVKGSSLPRQVTDNGAEASRRWGVKLDISPCVRVLGCEYLAFGKAGNTVPVYVK